VYDLPTRTDITWGTRGLRQLSCRHIWGIWSLPRAGLVLSNIFLARTRMRASPSPWTRTSVQFILVLYFTVKVVTCTGPPRATP
jgi:hypothetical protein